MTTRPDRLGDIETYWPRWRVVKRTDPTFWEVMAPGDPRDVDVVDQDETFADHAHAIAYADRKAREL